MQRPGLLLSNHTIYVAFASNGCDTFAFHGWMMAYNQSNLQPAGVFNATPNGTDGGIWQSGGAPAVDTDGTIFVATGNGTFDGNTGGIFFNVPMTAYPTATWGIRARLTPTPQIYVMAGVYNGDPTLVQNSKHGVDWTMRAPLFAMGEVGFLLNQ